MSKVMIGLEVHAELSTRSKLFCACARKETSPNTQTCPICLGLPGSKPVLNETALRYALRLAKALKCDIAPNAIFSRKMYFYPDLSKNYQITQFEHPIGHKGEMVFVNGTKISLRRVHLEEDPGALVHPGGSIAKSPYVLIDYNRSGHPLCEIVTEPVIDSPEQAREFMRILATTLQYLGIYNEQDCILKADANVSIEESGFRRVEVKNIASFKDIQEALEYEIARQRKAIEDKEEIILETRGYDIQKKATFPLRKKESEEDYGYVTDPDLVPTPLASFMQEETIPQLPREKALMLIHKGVSQEDAFVLSADFTLVSLFEQLDTEAVFAAKLVRRDIPRILKYHSLDISVLDTAVLKECVHMFQNKKITERTLQKVLEGYSDALAKKRVFSPRDYVQKNDLEAESDTSFVQNICKQVIKENEKAVQDYKNGNATSLNFLFGLVMRQTKGKADPSTIKEMLEELLE